MRLIKLLASLKITNALLILLILELILFTAFPASKGGNRFNSPLFLFPLLLFFINLGACTVLRLIRYKSWTRPSRAGADLIHLGLLLVILAGLLTPLLRREVSFSMAEGDIRPFPGGESFSVTELDFTTYRDGRPESWIVRGKYGESPVLIEVNRPMKMKGLRLYLTNFTTHPFLVIEEGGTPELLDLTEGLMIQNRPWQLKQLIQESDGWTVILSNGDDMLNLRTGELRGDVLVRDVRLRHQARLLLVENPLRPLVAAGFILLAAGLVLVPAAKGRRFWQA